MSNIEIDLIYIAKRNLNINEYLTLVKLHEKVTGNDIPFYTTEKSLDSLQDKGYVVQLQGKYFLSRLAEKMFVSDTVNFDELYDLYPSNTPQGRTLRAKNKEVLGTKTRDYRVLSKKYYKIVKSAELHNEIIAATKRMIDDKVRTGKQEFYQKLETYINQNGWEQYIGIADRKVSSFKRNTERL